MLRVIAASLLLIHNLSAYSGEVFELSNWSLKPTIAGERFANWEKQKKVSSQFIKVEFFLQRFADTFRNSNLNKEAGDQPIHKLKKHDWSNRNEPWIAWLGHSTFLIRISGKVIITDPVLLENVGPIPYFFKRIRPVSADIQSLPKIDYILISHNHWDHLDAKTLKKLVRHSPDLKIIIPLNNGKFLGKEASFIELNWGEKISFPSLSFICLPAYHSSLGSGFDSDESLWASWMIKSSKNTIYFAGDSGYNTHFKIIGTYFDRVDIALLPIGGLEPYEMMNQNHLTPAEAFQAAKDINAQVFIPMHFETFKLSDEHSSEPRKLLKEQSLLTHNSNVFLQIMTQGLIGDLRQAMPD